jgi:DNA ligase 1
MSEKLDGIRSYWNGKNMISRHGKEIKCPVWFIEQFPTNISLDGEIWFGRGTLEFVNEILNSSKDLIEWKGIYFMIFDLPNSNEPYEIRIRDLSNIQFSSNNIQIIDIERCKGNNYIQQYLSNIMDEGGEGIMVNKPNSNYIPMRVDTLLKVKVNFLEYFINLILLSF